MSAHWTPPANRSNQYLRRYRLEHYTMPKSDKIGNLSHLTALANQVDTTYAYLTGMRVYAVSAKREPITGIITEAFEGMGLPLYHVRDDSGHIHTIAENGIKFVLSIVVATQHTQALENVA